MIKVQPAPPEPVYFICACGHAFKRFAQHYQVVACPECRKSYWALRPLKAGPLRAFEHPGYGQPGSPPPFR